MKIFITGIAGFLGSHLADTFIADGHEVVGNDNLIGGYLDNVPKKAKLYRVDCNDVEKMKKIMKGVDIVYHTAATAYEGLSVFSPHLVDKNIAGAGIGTLVGAIHNKVKRFVSCSSMSRYGTNKVPFTEDMTPRPQDPYAVSKVALEEQIKILCGVNKIPWVIAVPHNIIGPRQKYDDPFRNVASIMINLMLQGRQPIIYGNGQQKRCFSFIDDDLYCLKRLATQDNVIGETINIGPDEEFVTIKELAETIADIIGMELKPNYYPDRPQEVILANCSADKARKLLGYETKTTLREGLTKMVNYIKERGVKKFSYHLPIEIINERTPKTWVNKIF